MKKTHIIIKQQFFLPILVALLSMAGCMKEDFDDCVTTTLLVKFDETMFDLPVGEHKIEDVHVFVFDETFDKWIDLWQGDAYDYSQGKNYEIPIELSPGYYNFRVWTNLNTPIRTNTVNNDPTKPMLEEFNLYLDGMKEIPDFHYGQLDKALFTHSEHKQHIIYLLPDTYRINLTVTGEIPRSDVYETTITDNNSHFDFNNRILPDAPEIKHKQILSFKNNIYHASMRILPLTNDHALENIGKISGKNRSPELIIDNVTTGKQLFKEDLVKMIETAYKSGGQQVDFDKTYLFDITLSFDANMDVTVKVNGWSYLLNGTVL